MRIFRHTAGLPDAVRGGVVTIGNFDGVHLGHQEVIGAAAREAERRGGMMTVVTFEPHPRRFFRADDPPFELTPLRSKVRWLRAIGVETLQLVHFDADMSQASAADFVQSLLIDGLDARHVVVGYDFVFGHGRKGNIDTLRGLSDGGAFGLTAVDPVSAENGPVYSSTNIRGYLRTGDPLGAAGLLGRCWEIEGRVQMGDQRGRTIGFPTANIPIDDYVEPALGVYAVWAGIERDGATEWHMGSANIGHRPTFDGEGVVLEVYLFDFTDDIYNQLLRVALVDYIRPERKFDGIPELREQIALDCGAARKLLESIQPGDLRGPPGQARAARGDGQLKNGGLDLSIDYKSTIYLPKTEFAMRGKLPEREPELLDRWARMKLFERLRDDAKGREKFILHDGPPYANGHLHIGHALNKILKDVINRSQQMLGRDANYVPGWDCHGLPIEWKIEEKYRAEGKDKDEVPTIEFRAECRDFAAHWIDIQREEFKRLGVEGDWDNPYTTMTYAAEAQIVAELGKFLLNGGLFKGAKPVMWSVVEKTALAEAEVEYKDHKSTTIWVRFPVVSAQLESLNDASVMIWTTTPWTIPGNRAVAYGPDMEYVVIEVAGVLEDSLACPGEKLAMAEALIATVAADIGVTDYKVLENLKGADLSGAVCRHPFHGRGYDFDVPLLPGDHVTAEDGTGFVHTAPGHGAEDFVVGQAHGIEVPQTVGPDGLFYDHVPLFAGDHVYKVNGKIADTLLDAGALLKRGNLTHSYPHSWRSKAPLIFRNTPQWFISMDSNDLRQKALDAIDKTNFYPEAGRNRLRTMIETRPDWCVSRQRAWGVPITVFVNKQTGEPLRDAGVMDRIVAAVAEEGADAWFASDPRRFLGDNYDAADYEQVTDILDVWFDSGSTHAFVLEARDELRSPASLYLEGSDQHRGWFHSSLLESCGTRGRAPYEGVLTHGFVLAEDKLKMSKSSGNTVAPQDVIKSHGADILRLWVVASDYSEDLKIGPEIIKHQADAYRRLRNTMRFLLGNLDGFGEDEIVAPADMPELDRWVLHRLFELDELVRNAANSFDFHAMFTALHNFCAVDLSAFYFDVRKDILYCSRRDDPARRAARTVLDQLFSCLTAWLAPILCFTAEEAWLSRNPGDDESVHLRQFPELPADWRDDALAEKWETIRTFRRAVTGALEIERAAKRIGSSLQAAPVIYADDRYRAAMDGIDMAEICITSEAHFGDGEPPPDAHRAEDGSGISVTPALAEGEKCERCWRFMPDVGDLSGHPTLCGRCADAVDHFPIAAE